MSAVRERAVSSADGTTIAYRSLGAGAPVVVVGGVLSTAEDYLPLARSLARGFEVHVVERRGRGASGAQGEHYGIERECEDLEAVLAETAATRVFGHSFGGLVALETAKRAAELARVAVYEPGVSVDGSIPMGWIDRYRELLARGDNRGAFACLARGSGHAPAIVERLPLWYLRLVLPAAVGRARWRRMEPLLGASLAEHEEVRRLDGTLASYARVAMPVLLLAGRRSPRGSTATLEALARTLPAPTVDVLDGLSHEAPATGASARVAERLEAFFG